MGAVGSYVSNGAIFITVALLCVPALIALSFIVPGEIDYARARNAAKKDSGFETKGIAILGTNRNLLIFAFCLVLFQFSNASQLPLISQSLGQSQLASRSLIVAGMVVIPQMIFAFLAPWVGYWSELYGRKPLLLIGFGADALRAVLYAFISDPHLMLAIQLLDGVTASIVTVLTVLVITDVTVGTGRFNLAQGVVGLLQGVAATFSTPLLGGIMQHFGDRAGFLLLAGASSAAVAILWTFLPETREPTTGGHGGKRPHDDRASQAQPSADPKSASRPATPPGRVAGDKRAS
jgi:predicted MFS family arabinose efflux permease